MAKNNNKGFSLVEIIIAVAVFAILITPLTTQLISAVSTNRRSVKKQYAVEKAEEIMETFKTADLSGSAISISDGNSAGKFVFTLDSKTEYEMPLPTGVSLSETPKYTEWTYSCSNLSYAEGYEDYTCSVTVNNKAHVASELGYVWDENTNDYKKNSDGTYVKTTEGTGTVRTLTNKQYAVIANATYTGTTESLDDQATQHFRETEEDIMKRYNTVAYNQYKAGNLSLDASTFSKKTTIKISNKNTGGKYKIQCLVTYTDEPGIKSVADNMTNDDKTFQPESKYGLGIVYECEYDELPPIYLIYSPAVSNGRYVDSDEICIDTSDLTLPSGTDSTKVYIFETAAGLDSASSETQEIIKNALNVTSIDDLTYRSESYSGTAASVKVRVNLTGSASGQEADDLAKFKAYANFTIDQDNSSVTVNGLSEDTSDETYLYAIDVVLTNSSGDKTTVSGARGR